MPHSSYISKHLLLLLATLLFALTSFAQGKFAGRVTDAKTKEPLAFVNIIYNAKNQGTSTDLDGYFKIDDYSKIEFLRISYLGYTTEIVSKDELGAKHYIEIALDEDVTSLAEVTVLPGENPAHRIVNLVIANANRNNPEKMRSFSYVSYNKMYFTADVKPSDDTIIITPAKDTIETLSKILSKQHILLIESVTERIFRYPDNNKENVLAHRMSGMKNPAFTLLATQFQSMSFYSDNISLLDKRFLSPISKGSTSKYFFQIEDTMYNSSMDTVFVISFIPLKNKVFDGLKGVMNINTNGYAIESITAEPNEPSEVFTVSIQQKYELVDSIQWFPVQLNTNLIFNILQVPDGTKPAEGERQTYTPMVGIGKSYISDISLNPDIKRREFINQGVLVNDKATKQDDDFWNQYRKDSLTSKDLETYRVIDSLGKEINLDKKVEIMEILAAGYIPWKFINFDLGSIIWFNEYEKVRLGLGIETNERLTKWVTLGGYGAYGFGDKAWKYGAKVQFNLWPSHDLKLGVTYKRDLDFSDGMAFNRRTTKLSSQSVYEWFLSEMDSISEHKAYVEFKALRYLSARLQFRHYTKDIINTDRYNFTGIIDKHYTAAEAGIYLRFAYKEKFFQTPRGTKVSLGTKYPIMYFNFIKSVPVTPNANDYYKLEAQIYKHFVIRKVGDTYLILTGGYIGGNPRYSELYYASGTDSWLNIDNTFNTMRPNEFISDRFCTFHFMHDFGNVLYKKKYSKPSIAITTSLGWGDCKLTQDVDGSDYARKMNKGYFESGLQLNNLLCLSIEGFGLGVYYRYGPYRFTDKEIKNWAFKLTWTLTL